MKLRHLIQNRIPNVFNRLSHIVRGSRGSGGQQIVVNMSEAGTLDRKIGSRRVATIADLKVVGEINDRDLSFVRKMARRCLRRLDLSEARITSSKYDFNTRKNVVAPNAFAHCTNLEEISLPNDIVFIGNNAFECCRRLSMITIPNSVTAIDSKAFYECSGLQEIRIPDSVATIGSYAFFGCSRLASAVLPSGLTQINTSMFEECSSLSAVDIPEGVERIGENAFCGCRRLQTVNLPKSVERISAGVFSGCSMLKAIYVYCRQVPAVRAHAFSGCPSKCNVYVPKGMLHDYWLSEFGHFDNIVEF